MEIFLGETNLEAVLCHKYLTSKYFNWHTINSIYVYTKYPESFLKNISFAPHEACKIFEWSVGNLPHR